jgi:anti-sigma factor RsiW
MERWNMKNAETRWWVVASLVAVAAVLVGMLLAGVFGGLLPPE